MRFNFPIHFPALRLPLIAMVTIVLCGPPAGSAPVPASNPPALVLSDPGLPGNDARRNQILANCLVRAGYATRIVTVTEAARPDTLSPAHCALFALPTARQLPLSLIAPLRTYLSAGGNLVALGTPLGSIVLVPSGTGQWVDPLQLQERSALLPPAQVLFNFPAGENLGNWQRSTSSPTSPMQKETIDVSDQGRTARALHVVINNLDGWDTLMSPPIERAFPADNTTTVFSARGGPHTRSLAVEWDERDGSRWIAVVPLTTHWRRYELSPSKFLPWSPPQNRIGTSFQPENAVKMSVGLAYSHTGAVPGSHEYWVAQFGTSPAASVQQSLSETALPAMDTLAPDYKFYPIHGPVRLRIDPTLTPNAADIPVPTNDLSSPHSRPDGAGFDKQRGWRQIALLTAVDARTGEWRGTPATLRIAEPNTGNGGMIASFTSDDTAFYGGPKVQALLIDTARKMRIGLFLIDGGAEFYTLFPGQSVRLGARLVQLTPGPASGQTASVRIRVADGGGQVIWQHTWPVHVTSQQATQYEATCTPAVWPERGYRVTTELLTAGKVVDHLQHDLNVWMPSQVPDYIAIDRAGHFMDGSGHGRPWRILGVNYMPSSGIGVEDSHYFEYWLDRAAYDPAIVERDLSHIQSLGCNAVSVFEYVEAIPAQNLLDFLLRCRRHKLRVNLSLRPVILGYLDRGPTQAVEAAWQGFKQILDSFRLRTNDTVFAYDIDWEPEFGNREARRKMDPQWRDWVDKRYGDLAAAERAWGTTAPRNPDGTLGGPTNAQVAGREPMAAKLATDYRRFLDGWLVLVYGEMRRRLHTADPNHAVSFRMSEAGDPTNDQAGSLPYQFEGLGRAVDFLSPEGYGRIGNWERVKPGWFEVVYGRAVAPGRPIVWAEVGTSIWDASSQGEDPEALAAAGRFYADFMQMARLSGSDGIIWWWYPGGFRVGENSDFGLLNPDGTDRPATQAIRQHGAEFLQAPFPAPDVWLSFDRDRHPDGIHGVYAELAGRFWQEVAQGHHPGLRTTP